LKTAASLTLSGKGKGGGGCGGGGEPHSRTKIEGKKNLKREKMLSVQGFVKEQRSQSVGEKKRKSEKKKEGGPQIFFGRNIKK